MEWRERIEVRPEVLVGKPVIKGTRISVEHVLELLGGGWTEMDIVDNFPHLEVEDVRACLLYARAVLATEHVLPTAS